MPSAIRPTSSSGWREFFRVIRLSVASSGGQDAESDDPERLVSGTPCKRDVADEDPREKRTHRQREAGHERDDVRPHAGPNIPRKLIRESSTREGATQSPCVD